MKLCIVCVLAIASALPLWAQREFLTSDEIEKVREAQEPNMRLKLYVLFARQRMDQLRQQMAKDKKGRSLIVRDLLNDYSEIIDAIDTVSDDALSRKVDISAGVSAAAAAEKNFLTQLQQLQASNPHDLDMYDIDLKQAIDDTSDSIDSSREDLGKRSAEVIAKVDAEKKKVEELTPKDQLKEEKTENAKAGVGVEKRKPPTLYRAGEHTSASDTSKQR
ncbi:MAG: hypothetical protein KGN84_22710 [Acidobacteriota bacterium]|nr:hypothetical protein [Acidobacteriota bacterium]